MYTHRSPVHRKMTDYRRRDSWSPIDSHVMGSDYLRAAGGQHHERDTGATAEIWQRPEMTYRAVVVWRISRITAGFNSLPVFLLHADERARLVQPQIAYIQDAKNTGSSKKAIKGVYIKYPDHRPSECGVNGRCSVEGSGRARGRSGRSRQTFDNLDSQPSTTSIHSFRSAGAPARV